MEFTRGLKRNLVFLGCPRDPEAEYAGKMIEGRIGNEAKAMDDVIVASPEWKRRKETP